MSAKLWIYLGSRLILGGALGWWIFGTLWQAAVLAMLVATAAMLYLKSGWFPVDFSNAWMPLREDERNRTAQLMAFRLAAGTVAGIVLAVTLLNLYPALELAAGTLALKGAVITYLASRIFFLARA